MRFARLIWLLVFVAASEFNELHSEENSSESKRFQTFKVQAEAGDMLSQHLIADYYMRGVGVEKNPEEAVKWEQKAAEQGFSEAQTSLGLWYFQAKGVTQDYAKAVHWFSKAANHGDSDAQHLLGSCYYFGQGVAKDVSAAVKWERESAERGFDMAQYRLGLHFESGEGVPKDYVEAYKWYNLASAQGHGEAKSRLSQLERFMPESQVAEAQRLARSFKRRHGRVEKSEDLPDSSSKSSPKSSGSGFFISSDGYLFTNEHVVGSATDVRLLTTAGLISAKVVKVDSANDLALLKAEGKFSALPIASSRSVKLGATVATVGFPNIGLQGFAPKLAKGEIASLSGAGDDARYFQISAPVQPGNSGGALVDERGNVVGIVSAKLSARAALASSGALPENVNYAVKSSFLLSFLESVPEVSAQLKDPETKEQKFEDVVKAAEQSAVLVLVY